MDTDIVKALQKLLNEWHELVETDKGLDGYVDTPPDGDGIQLMLLINRTVAGDLKLTAFSVRDIFEALLASGNSGAVAEATLRSNKPSASVTVSRR